MSHVAQDVLCGFARHQIGEASRPDENWATKEAAYKKLKLPVTKERELAREAARAAGEGGREVMEIAAEAK